MTDAAARHAAAKRQRRARERHRHGRVVFHVEADEFAIAEWLIASGRLNEAQAASRLLVERELGRVIAKLSESGW